MPMAMQDLNPVPHQTKATFTPVKGSIPPRPANAVVQHVRPAPEPTQAGPDLFNEIESEFAAQQAAETTPEATGDGDEIEGILKRFKGSPDEIARQIAKSYSASEKRMRQLESEKQLLVKQGGQPTVQQPVAQAVAPVMQQVQVVPTFDFKKAGDKFLDAPDQHLKDLATHIQSSAEQKLFEVAAPIYEELIDARLFRKYPDVVTEENLDVIKAMAHTEAGANRWEKTVNAVTKYKTSMPTMTPRTPNAEVQAMQQATQTPAPQARASGEKKMWKESDIQSTIQKKIRSGEYQRDPRFRTLIDTAYREGRVLRGQ